MPDTTPSNTTKINLGCGHILPPGWVNVDGSYRAWLASRLPRIDRALTACRILPKTEFNDTIMWCNLLKKFPWADNSVDVIYMGEIMEHFTQEQGRQVLENSLRVLKPDGVLRIRVPDNARFWRNYLAEYDAIRAKPRDQQNRNHERWTHMFFREICTNPSKFGSAGYYHKWMYDDVSLIMLLEELGYHNVERMPFHDSRIDDITVIEERDDLIVECTKPTVQQAMRLAA